MQGSPLTGASYDIAKSKFAFGSPPVRKADHGIIRWTGDQGVVGIFADGSTLGSLNGGAAEAAAADWSADTAALIAHVRDYFIAMGVAPCQIGSTQILGGSSGRVVSLNRAVAEIPIVESGASARFNKNDLTTAENFYWPTISAAVVAAARSFQDQLHTPAGLAAYKAHLPARAQGKGQVVVHHSPAGSMAPFKSVATYDVIDQRSILSFSADAKSVTLPE